MTNTSTVRTGTLVSLAVTCLCALSSPAQNNYNSGQPASESKAKQLPNLETEARQTIDSFKQQDPTLETFFRNAAGYAVFPTVGEGAFIVGGAHGKGMVYQNGQPIGEATVTKGTIGAQAGGESYSELVFFENPQSLQRFKQGNFEFSAGVSAVAAKAGAGANTNYRNGVAVFTAARKGLMAKAAIGGQKFTFQPLAVGGAVSEGLGGTTSGTGSK